eukprot:6350713-Prymnesium_polylepis.1
MTILYPGQFGALAIAVTGICAPARIAPPYGARSALGEPAGRAGVRVRRRIGMRLRIAILGLESLGLLYLVGGSGFWWPAHGQ